MIAEEILKQMTLDEKLNLCVGANFWQTISLERFGLKPLTMADGPHGLRVQENAADMLGLNESLPATCFPTASISACSWDEELIGEMAAAITAEAIEKGVDIVLGPGMNIKRNPLCGRNFEYFSEDPYLTGKLATAFVTNGQKHGVGTCLKHFAANSQEFERHSSNSKVDERTMREIYLPAFEMAVKEGRPDMVMCAYNKINGIYCSDNQWLLHDVLRDEWGFDGIVVTDWGAMHDVVSGYQAGCDLAMPGGTTHLQKHAKTAIESGLLSEDDVNRSALRILKRMTGAKECDVNGAEKHPTVNDENVSDKMYLDHHHLAKKVALESAVLLKNDGILPLNTKKVCLVGHMAKYPRYQGAGSSHINPTKLTSLYEVAKEWNYAQGCDEMGDTTDELLAESIECAKSADVAVVVAGLPGYYESEGFDRSDMKMPQGHLRLIDAVSCANPNTVVVLVGGSPMEVPWFDQVKAVLYVGLPGQAGYEAVYDLLTGVLNPSGKLAETWPIVYEDVISSSYYGEPRRDAYYMEGIYVGYRHYETADKQVRFPFGYGLSYTTFEYSDLCIQDTKVALKVKNTGLTPGAEVVQLYISPKYDMKNELHRPAKELKGFKKVFLQPGEECSVTFTLNERCFAIWQNGWKIPAGAYDILIGASVQDIRMSGQIEKEHVFLDTDLSFNNLKSEFPDIKTDNVIPKPGQFTFDHSLRELSRYSMMIRIVIKVMERIIAKRFGIKPDYNHPEFRMCMAASVDAPLFSTVNCAADMFPEHMARAVLHIGNRQFLRAIKQLISK